MGTMPVKRVKPEPKTPVKDTQNCGEDADEPNPEELSEPEAEPLASELNSAKRHKQEIRPRGQILKVRMRNFMTYGDVTVVPGPLLNLVLGPNGTGKSSLVNALCLGLGGSTALLGRADKVSDFVRKGHSQGSTEVHLSSGSRRPIIITRNMNSEDGTSKWLLNGKAVTMQIILETVADLKIQVDNLCQFLPQDKVVMFARLTPVQLLMETEKAIGSGELWDLHQKLATGTNKQADADQDVGWMENDLTRNKAQNSELEREVKRFKERTAVLQQVSTMSQKLPWVRYWERKAGYKEANKKLNQKQQELDSITEQSNLQKQPLIDKQLLVRRATRAHQTVKEAVRKAEMDCTGSYNSAYKMQDDMDDQLDKIGALETDAKIRTDRIALLRDKVATSEAAINELGPPPEADTQRAEELQREAISLGTKARRIATETTAVADLIENGNAEFRMLRDQLRKMDDAKLQRLRNMERMNPGIGEVVRWIAEHKEEFQGQVLGPIACEVECTNPLHQDMLEQSVAGNVWTTFVTETKVDQDILIRATANNRWRYRPSVSCYDGDHSKPVTHPRGDISALRQLGVESTLDQVFIAPSLVKHILCDESNINETYICAAGSEQHMDALSQHGISSMWLPDSWVRTNTSAYNSNSRSQTVIPKRKARNLNVSAVSSTVRAQLLADIQECQLGVDANKMERNTLDEARVDVETRREAVRKEQHDNAKLVTQHKNKLRGLQSMLRSDERGLASAIARPNPQDNEPQMQAALENMASEALLQTKKSVRKLQEMWEKMKAMDHISLHLKEVELIVAALERKGTDLDSRLRDVSLDFERLERDVAREFADTKRALAAAEEATEGKLSDEQKEEFEAVSHLGSTAEEIEVSMAMLKAEADAIVCNNPDVMEDYQKRANRIAELEGQLQRRRNEVEARAEELRLLEEEWLPQLRRITARINTTFGRIFAKIGCAGEVALHLDQRDYHQCSMNIKVKFREEEELQNLNAQRQSGGERSVCTVLYLVALQDVAACPFRIVDEINQGMDQYNERKVFLELVNAATGEGTPQSFLLTPKLLPGLPFSSAVTVLQIMNGYKIADVACGYTDAAMLGGRQPIAAC